MITITKSLENQPILSEFNNSNTHFPNKMNNSLFFDIETTGFSARTTMCYLIGCVYIHQDTWQYTQWFAESPTDEASIITAFCEFAQSFQCLIHFNGDNFDLPYLLQRCRYLGLNFSIQSMNSVDLFKIARRTQKLLKLENYKQKTIEDFLDVKREDACSGKDLIKIYQEYVRLKDQELLNLLLLHNHDDICGLINILPILAYRSIIDGLYSPSNIEFNSSTDYSGLPVKEVIFTMTLPARLPVHVSYGANAYYITAFSNVLKLRVRLYTGELKYFYPNYKDYYYLPEEDRSIHKSVAFYVDKNFRTQAKAANCYSKKTGLFLPQFSEIITPYFKIDYADKSTYFEAEPSFMENKELHLRYVKDVLAHIL